MPLAFLAGIVDAIGYLTLLSLYLAHMTGNTASVGVFLSRGKWSYVIHFALPIPAFMFGGLIGAGLTEVGHRGRGRVTLAVLLSLEATLLGCFLALARIFGTLTQSTPSWQFDLLAAVPAVATGMQNAALREANGRALHTTFISGALISAAEEAIALCFWIGDHIQGRTRKRRALVARVALRRPALRRLVLYSAIWLMIGVGALSGAALHSRWGANAILVPIFGLLLLAVWDLLSPMYVLPNFSPPGTGRRQANGRDEPFEQGWSRR